MPNTKSAFSLLEMSIVIVIIGLIAGGILVSRDMMRSAEIRSVVEEAQLFTQALNNFNDKYKALPGDFSNAIDHWGYQHVTPATCPSTYINADATCDGDGNGWITTQGTSSTYYEQFHAWQQLRRSGMTSQYVNFQSADGGTQNKIVGDNIPPSKLDGAGWALYGLPVNYVTVTNLDIIAYHTNDVRPGHVLALGGNNFTGFLDSVHQEPRLSGSEAKELDEKIDDALPDNGKVVRQYTPAGAQCASGSVDYNISDSQMRCTLLFKTGL